MQFFKMKPLIDKLLKRNANDYIPTPISKSVSPKETLTKPESSKPDLEQKLFDGYRKLFKTNTPDTINALISETGNSLECARQEKQTYYIDEFTASLKTLNQYLEIVRHGFTKTISYDKMLEYFYSDNDCTPQDYTIRNYPGVIPDSVLQTYENVKGLNLFDNFEIYTVYRFKNGKQHFFNTVMLFGIKYSEKCSKIPAMKFFITEWNNHGVDNSALAETSNKLRNI